MVGICGWDLVEASPGACRRGVPLGTDGIRERDMLAGLLDGCRRGVPLAADGIRGWDVVAVPLRGCAVVSAFIRRKA
ncbi:hypothetical protein GCM10009764_38340 [Nocardia ninae]|uniref:Uncharacterized protein n=1 Tax=Nocardia ninae NBRC 108245 TaxID=1210091 RepID=A0A511MIJ9_9NOCA|nr:hypothetical protein NN4_50030 [Nocardia ninae NBRC 108245]